MAIDARGVRGASRLAFQFNQINIVQAMAVKEVLQIVTRKE